MSNGGPDGRYALTITASGDFGFTRLRKLLELISYNYSWGGKLPDDSFLGQVYHSTGFPGIAPNTTTGPYRDTINWLVKKVADDVVVRAFSISEIAGAYGDDGQNYKNIIQVNIRIAWHQISHFNLLRL